MNNPALDKAEQIRQIQEYDGEDKIVSSFQMQELVDKEKGNQIGFCSAIPSLDKLLDGFQGGELVTISGKTGAGKTLFAQTLTSYFAKQRVQTLWFSYEMTALQFFSRFPKLPLFYLPLSLKERALHWIESKILEARVKEGVKAVFIDHLHFLIDLAVTQNPSLQIGQIVRKLKKMALQHNIVIFLLCHIEKIKSDIPTIDDIRDSAFIPAESDIVLIVWRIEDNENKDIINQSGISVEKSRRTGAWKKKIKLIKQNGLLYEVEKREDKDDRRPVRPASN